MMPTRGEAAVPYFVATHTPGHVELLFHADRDMPPCAGTAIVNAGEHAQAEQGDVVAILDVRATAPCGRTIPTFAPRPDGHTRCGCGVVHPAPVTTRVGNVAYVTNPGERVTASNVTATVVVRPAVRFFVPTLEAGSGVVLAAQT